MVSEYGLIELADLEDRAHRKYSDLKSSTGSSYFSDDVVYSWISQAEALVCSCTKDWTDPTTLPRGVRYSIIELAFIIASNALLEAGYNPRWQYKDPLDILDKLRHGPLSRSEMDNTYISGDAVDNYVPVPTTNYIYGYPNYTPWNNWY